MEIDIGKDHRDIRSQLLILALESCDESCISGKLPGISFWQYDDDMPMSCLVSTLHIMTHGSRSVESCFPDRLIPERQCLLGLNESNHSGIAVYRISRRKSTAMRSGEFRRKGAFRVHEPPITALQLPCFANVAVVSPLALGEELWLLIVMIAVVLLCFLITISELWEYPFLDTE